MHCIQIDDDKWQCVYCAHESENYGKSRGRTDKDPSWTNTAAGRHFTEKHKAELMPVFPSELVRAKQKAAYYLRAICRHKQAYEFFHNGSGPLLWCCWCNNPRRPQIVNNPFGHEIQEIVLPEPDSIPPAKKRRRCAAVEGAQQSEQPQLEAGPITSNASPNPHSAEKSTSEISKQRAETNLWKLWISELERQAKRYATKNAIEANIPVSADSIDNTNDTQLLKTAKSCLSEMVKRLERSEFGEKYDVTLMKAKIQEGYSHDVSLKVPLAYPDLTFPWTYTKQLVLWYVEEIGRLTELFHAVKALMAGDVGAGFSLPHNVVFLGDEPPPAGPSVTGSTSAPSESNQYEHVLTAQQPHFNQACSLMPNGYTDYSSSEFQPLGPYYQQQHPLPGVLPYWSSTLAALLSPRNQLEQRRPRTRRMSLGGAENVLNTTSPAAAHSRSFEPTGQHITTQFRKVHQERTVGRELFRELCKLKLSIDNTGPSPKGLIEGPAVGRARLGTSTTQLLSSSGAYTLNSALFRLTPGPSDRKSSAIAVDCDATSYEAGDILQSAEDCERTKQKWTVEDSKTKADGPTTTQAPDPNDEQSAQRQLAEEQPRTNAKPTLTVSLKSSPPKREYVTTFDLEEELEQRLIELSAEIDQQCSRELPEQEQTLTESGSSSVGGRESRTSSSKCDIDAETANTEPVQEKTDLVAPPYNKVVGQSGLIIDLASLQIVRNLGAGAFGHVFLAIDRQNPDVAVAVKCVDLSREDLDAAEDVLNETLMQHKLRNHENVLKCIGMRVTVLWKFQLFMEYADGGELFDYVEPDVGMPPSMAFYYFKQLIDGLEYIHSKEIAHRNITLEKLLVTKKNVLKISDFGTATTFQDGGKKLVLRSYSVTAFYAAPEVYDRDA